MDRQWKASEVCFRPFSRKGTGPPAGMGHGLKWAARDSRRWQPEADRTTTHCLTVTNMTSRLARRTRHLSARGLSAVDDLRPREK